MQIVNRIKGLELLKAANRKEEPIMRYELKRSRTEGTMRKRIIQNTMEGSQNHSEDLLDTPILQQAKVPILTDVSEVDTSWRLGRPLRIANESIVTGSGAKNYLKGGRSQLSRVAFRRSSWRSVANWGLFGTASEAKLGLSSVVQLD